MNHHINITRIKAVHNALGALKDKVVFVGGATVSLYADSHAGEVRPTDDIDILIELWTYAEIAKVEEQLRKKGFEHVVDSKFKYRYKVHGIIVDMMTMDEESLGFVNKWYHEGFKNATDYSIDELHTVKIFSPSYFIASKLEAFKNRSSGDGRTSEDFEDIVYVMENRNEIWKELQESESKLKKYLIEEIKKLQSNSNFEEWIDANTEWGSPPASYMIIEELKKFTGID